MTKLLSPEELPSMIKEEVLKDLTNLVSSKKPLNGLCLEYIQSETNDVYILYLTKNAAGKIEESYFVTNDIIMDFRKKSKPLVSLESLLNQ